VSVRAFSPWALWLTLFLGAAAACTSKPVGPNESCTRSSQCKIGLACIDGRCSDDLDALRGQSTVPMLMPDEPAQEPEQPPGAGEPSATPPPADDAG
jgi:hypothetical protein